MTTKIVTTIVVGLLLSTWGHAQQKLDEAGAGVYMKVAEFAKITNLDDIYLYTDGVDGDKGAIYNGSDQFNLESNTAVQVVLTGTQLTNGESEVKTEYILDKEGMNFNTAAGVHNGEHMVRASAQLGNISSQEAGDYKGSIQVTVSTLP